MDTSKLQRGWRKEAAQDIKQAADKRARLETEKGAQLRAFMKGLNPGEREMILENLSRFGRPADGIETRTAGIAADRFQAEVDQLDSARKETEE